MAVPIPDKLYFRIGEVADLAGVKPSVLRYWESEFPVIRPAKSTTGQRLYSRKEVELVLQIRRFLYDERLTIEGTRKKLRERKGTSGFPVQDDSHTELLRQIRDDLLEVRKMLEQENGA